MSQPELPKIFALANAFKEGDEAVGGTRDDAVRAEAREVLAATTLEAVNRHVWVDDGVSAALARATDAATAAELAPLTVGAVKRALLSPRGAAWAQRYRAGLSSEALAAVVKIMDEEELAAVAQKLFNPLPGVGVRLGGPRHFGSRIQPNSAGDDEEEILFSVLEGLSYGCGDVIIGLNPASDEVDSIAQLAELLRGIVTRLRLPTRYCVLSDLVKQDAARQRAKMDVGFQSLAGTSAALQGMAGLDADGALDLARGFDGLYFETGQGAEVTNGAAAGLDMVTLESRTYGVARYLQRQTGKWMIVNDVAGFIGPEVFRTGAQLRRACLEDAVLAKLHGLTMGLDVCSTFHMGLAPAELQELTAQIARQAAPAYLMAVAGNADPMLGYLTTSFREHPRLQALAGRRRTSVMQRRLRDLGALDADGAARGDAATTAALYAAYQRAGGDTRSRDALHAEARRKLAVLQERGFDLGYGHGADYAAPPMVVQRLAALYGHARRALYAEIEESTLDGVAPRRLRVRTQARSREDYLAHPVTGETLRPADAAQVQKLYPARRPQVQFVLSDGLNADALNENLRALLPPLKHELAASGLHVGATDIIVTNGRVRAGYHVGALLDVEIIVHLIGERPGTGLNTLSAYLTYGRDPRGDSRWRTALEHAHTTAVCGIHRQGKPPLAAAAEIARCVRRMLAARASGVALGRSSNAEARTQ
jgi:ethanolamine ammonia-lyase large subunit